MSWFNKSGARDANCSFCHLNYREVGPLVEGPSNVFICVACIRQCDAIVQQEYERRNGVVKAFLVVDRLYRFTTDTTTRLGVLRTRLPHPHEHWVQIDPADTAAGAVAEPTWINLLHVHTVAEVAREDVDTSAPAAPPITNFRAADRKRGFSQ